MGEFTNKIIIFLEFERLAEFATPVPLTGDDLSLHDQLYHLIIVPAPIASNAAGETLTARYLKALRFGGRYASSGASLAAPHR